MLQFPSLPGQDMAVKRTPIWRTLRQKAISGRETFQPQWQAPLWHYEVAFNVLGSAAATQWGTSQEFQTLVGFYNQVMAAPGGLFKYRDAGDNSVVAQPVATGDGTTRNFQLVRALGGFSEPVLDPVAASVYVAGTGVSFSWLNGSADESGGVVVLASAPASGAAVTWAGSYNWLCRFDDDSLEFSNFMYLLWALKKCAFTTVRL